MLAITIWAVVLYFLNSDRDNSSYYDALARKVLLIFAPINFLDFLFWIWGLLTLTYENGDKIRDALMAPNPDEEYHYPQV